MSQNTMSENLSPAESCQGRQSLLPNHIPKVLDLRIQQQKQQLDKEDEISALQVASNDPRLWSREDVSGWLQWAVRFYQLDDVDTLKFAMNGRGVCLLTRSGFLSRAPFCGDVLHSDFQRRYAVAVLKSEEERKTRKRVAWQGDPASTDKLKRSKVEKKHGQKT